MGRPPPLANEQRDLFALIFGSNPCQVTQRRPAYMEDRTVLA
jgi:hypothetical protein